MLLQPPVWKAAAGYTAFSFVETRGNEGDSTANDHLGYWGALSGDGTAIFIPAIHYGANDHGSLMQFRSTDGQSTFPKESQYVGSDGNNSGVYAWAPKVTADGLRILGGYPFYGTTDAGRASTHLRSSSSDTSIGTPVQWTPTGTASTDQYGRSCDVTRDGAGAIQAAYDVPNSNAGYIWALTWETTYGSFYPDNKYTSPLGAQAGANFGLAGIACGYDGTRVAVTEYNRTATYTNEGCVHIYNFTTTSGSGSLSFVETLYSPNAANGGQFGHSVDIDDTEEHLVVGALGEGVIYYYKWSGSAFSLQQTISAPSAFSGYTLKSAQLSHDGLTLICLATDGSTDEQILVYTRDGTTWTYQEALQPSGWAYGELFRPLDIDSDGTTILASTPNRTDGDSNAQAGVFHVWKR